MRPLIRLLSAIVVLTLLLTGCGPETEEVADVTPSASAEETGPLCIDTSWLVVQADAGKLARWTAKGVPALAKADTPAEAKKALTKKWWPIVKADPQLLSGTVEVVLGKNVPPGELASDDCFTKKGVKMATMVEGALATAVVQPGGVDPTYYNTGTAGKAGRIVQASNPGITGNTNGVMVALGNGAGLRFGVLARCGNIAPESVYFPPGKTDNPKPPPVVHKPPPPPTTNPPPKKNKTPQSWEDQQNSDTGVRQDPQDNRTAEKNGVNTGPTTDGDGKAIVEPAPQPDRPANNRPTESTPAQPAPDPVDGGSNSGTSDGSGTPSGSTSNEEGVVVGDNDTSTPEDSGQGGTVDENDIDPGNPFG